MSYPAAPKFHADSVTHRRIIADVANGALGGRTNNTGEITLTAGATSTTLTDARLSVYSVVVFDPVTANAASVLAGGGMYVQKANRNNYEWTITHPSSANTDQTFRYAIIGGAEGLNFT